jgi:hypothetical protein
MKYYSIILSSSVERFYSFHVIKLKVQQQLIPPLHKLHLLLI